MKNEEQDNAMFDILIHMVENTDTVDAHTSPEQYAIVGVKTGPELSDKLRNFLVALCEQHFNS